MRYLFTLVVMLLLAAGAVPAQESSGENTPAAKITTPVKTDEFEGLLTECDRRARLDNFLIELQNNPETTGYVLIYIGGLDELPSQRWQRNLKKHFADHIGFRKFDAPRIVFIDAGYREHGTTEFWIIPPGFSPPEPSNTIERPKLPADKTYIHYRASLDSDNFNSDELLLQSVIDERKREEEQERSEIENSGAAGQEQSPTENTSVAEKPVPDPPKIRSNGWIRLLLPLLGKRN